MVPGITNHKIKKSPIQNNSVRTLSNTELVVLGGRHGVVMRDDLCLTLIASWQMIMDFSIPDSLVLFHVDDFLFWV